MSKSSWDKGFTSGAKAARKVSANSVCTLCCDGCKEHGERIEQERIIKLLEEMPWQIYSGVGIEGKPIESVWTPKVLIREDAIALIKGEKK